ncbi:hypothetical protein TELCIR_20325, partial [Teladorsagia circumcincta]
MEDITEEIGAVDSVVIGEVDEVEVIGEEEEVVIGVTIAEDEEIGVESAEDSDDHGKI